MLFGGLYNPRSCYSFSLSSQQWTKLPDLPSDRRRHGSVVIGQSAYLVGGDNNKNVDEYDLSTKQLRRITSMKTNRFDFGICVYEKSKILIAGGWENGSSDSCFLYDTISNTFETIGNLNSRRYGHVLVSDGKTAYAIGGCLNNKVLDTIEVLHGETHKWKMLKTTLIIPRRYHQAVVNKNSIYIIGGTDGNKRTDAIERFDTLTGTIELLNVKLKLARNSPAVAMHMNDLYIVGGFTGEEKTRTVEILDMDKQEIRDGEDVPAADCGSTACIFDFAVQFPRYVKVSNTDMNAPAGK